jgi:hypothetical protein
MAATPEAKVKAKVVALLKAYGAYYFFPATHGFGRSGVPDVVACLLGRFVAVECKAGKNTTTPLQDREIAAIKAADGDALVVNENNLAELEGILERIKNEKSTA